MNARNRDAVVLQLITSVIRTMLHEPETKNLIPLTPDHRKEWIKAMHEVVAHINEQIQRAQERLDNAR